MEFNISKNSLLKELEVIQHVIDKKHSNSILQNILIKATKHDLIEIMATDSSITIHSTCSANIKVLGQLLISAHELLNIVSLLPDFDVAFRTTKENISITCYQTTFCIAAQESELFPCISQINTTFCSIPTLSLKKLIEHTMFATSTLENQRLSLKGLFMEIKGNTIKFLGTDGHRLAIAQIELLLIGLDAQNAIIPKKSLPALLDLLKNSTNENTDLGFTNTNQVVFKNDNRSLTTLTINDKFPPWEKILLERTAHLAIIEKEPLIKAIQQVALMADDQGIIHLSFNNNQLEISASKFRGHALTFLSIKYTENPFRKTIKANYLLSYLNVLETTYVTFESSESNNFLCVKPLNSEKIKSHCIMLFMNKDT